MQTNSEQQPKERQRVSIFETIGEIYQWLEIVVAVFITGIIIACVVYYSRPDQTNRSWAIAIMIMSIVVGIVLATKAFRNKRKGQN